MALSLMRRGVDGEQENIDNGKTVFMRFFMTG
jgi:hypothetical protein